MGVIRFSDGYVHSDLKKGEKIVNRKSERQGNSIIETIYTNMRSVQHKYYSPQGGGGGGGGSSGGGTVSPPTPPTPKETHAVFDDGYVKTLQQGETAIDKSYRIEDNRIVQDIKTSAGRTISHPIYSVPVSKYTDPNEKVIKYGTHTEDGRVNIDIYTSKKTISVPVGKIEKPEPQEPIIKYKEPEPRKLTQAELIYELKGESQKLKGGFTRAKPYSPAEEIIERGKGYMMLGQAAALERKGKIQESKLKLKEMGRQVKYGGMEEEFLPSKKIDLGTGLKKIPSPPQPTEMKDILLPSIGAYKEPTQKELTERKELLKKEYEVDVGKEAVGGFLEYAGATGIFAGAEAAYTGGASLSTAPAVILTGGLAGAVLRPLGEITEKEYLKAVRPKEAEFIYGKERFKGLDPFFIGYKQFTERHIGVPLTEEQRGEYLSLGVEVAGIGGLMLAPRVAGKATAKVTEKFIKYREPKISHFAIEEELIGKEPVFKARVFGVSEREGLIGKFLGKKPLLVGGEAEVTFPKTLKEIEKGVRGGGKRTPYPKEKLPEQVKFSEYISPKELPEKIEIPLKEAEKIGLPVERKGIPSVKRIIDGKKLFDEGLVPSTQLRGTSYISVGKGKGFVKELKDTTKTTRDIILRDQEGYFGGWFEREWVKPRKTLIETDYSLMGIDVIGEHKRMTVGLGKIDKEARSLVLGKQKGFSYDIIAGREGKKYFAETGLSDFTQKYVLHPTKEGYKGIAEVITKGKGKERIARGVMFKGREPIPIEKEFFGMEVKSFRKLEESPYWIEWLEGKKVVYPKEVTGKQRLLTERAKGFEEMLFKERAPKITEQELKQIKLQKEFDKRMIELKGWGKPEDLYSRQTTRTMLKQIQKPRKVVGRSKAFTSAEKSMKKTWNTFIKGKEPKSISRTGTISLLRSKVMPKTKAKLELKQRDFLKGKEINRVYKSIGKSDVLAKMKYKPREKQREAVFLKDLFKPISKVASKQKQREGVVSTFTSLHMPAVAEKTREAIITTPKKATKKATAEKSIEKMFTETIPKIITPPPPPPPPPKLLFRIPIVFGGLDVETGKEKTEGYNVYAKHKGKFIKLNKKALPRKEALGLGGRAVDETTSAQFNIRKAKQKVKPSMKLFGDWDLLSSKFRPRIRGKRYVNEPNTFIEKNLFRIDSIGEFEGITVKGWKARKRKRNSLNLFF